MKPPHRAMLLHDHTCYTSTNINLRFYIEVTTSCDSGHEVHPFGLSKEFCVPPKHLMVGFFLHKIVLLVASLQTMIFTMWYAHAARVGIFMVRHYSWATQTAHWLCVVCTCELINLATSPTSLRGEISLKQIIYGEHLVASCQLLTWGNKTIHCLTSTIFLGNIV